MMVREVAHFEHTQVGLGIAHLETEPVVIGSITLSLRRCCRWLQPDILPWLPYKAPPPPGWSVA
jgi:hypothetical protein